MNQILAFSLAWGLEMITCSSPCVISCSDKAMITGGEWKHVKAELSTFGTPEMFRPIYFHI
jgi:hypothetical protein